MLSNDLRELSATFNAWSTGRAQPTIETWTRFKQDLQTCIAKASLLEFGIPVNSIDITAELLRPDSNLMLFPTPAERQQRRDQGGPR